MTIRNRPPQTREPARARPPGTSVAPLQGFLPDSSVTQGVASPRRGKLALGWTAPGGDGFQPLWAEDQFAPDLYLPRSYHDPLDVCHQSMSPASRRDRWSASSRPPKPTRRRVRLESARERNGMRFTRVGAVRCGRLPCRAGWPRRPGPGQYRKEDHPPRRVGEGWPQPVRCCTETWTHITPALGS